VIHYTDDLTSVREDMLRGFFVGWPKRPSASQHLAVLRGSYRSVVAIETVDERVVGFVNMLSDGVLTAFIPWLEVLPGYQRQGIGSELMHRRVIVNTCGSRSFRQLRRPLQRRRLRAAYVADRRRARRACR
jgi:GNAT superfamily N-acetyltransferase